MNLVIRYWLLVIGCFFSGCTCPAALDVAVIELESDVDQIRYARTAEEFERVTPIRMYQWESVRLDVTALHDVTHVALTNAGISVRWEAYSTPGATNAYIHKTGAVVSATSGLVRFELTPEEAGLPAGPYYSFVRAFQSVDGVDVPIKNGVLAYNRLEVLWAPDANSYTYNGPFPALTEYDPAWHSGTGAIYAAIAGATPGGYAGVSNFAVTAYGWGDHRADLANAGNRIDAVINSVSNSFMRITLNGVTRDVYYGFQSSETPGQFEWYDVGTETGIVAADGLWTLFWDYDGSFASASTLNNPIPVFGWTTTGTNVLSVEFFLGGYVTTNDLAGKIGVEDLAQTLTGGELNAAPTVAAVNDGLDAKVSVLPRTNAYPIALLIGEGDSNSTAAYATNATYLHKIRERVSTNCIVASYATSGHNSANILASIGAWTNLLTTNNIEYVTLMTGANDVTNSYSVATAAYSNLIVSVNALAGLDKLIVIGYMNYDTNIVAFNAYGKSLCDRLGIQFIDFANYVSGTNLMSGADAEKYTVSTNGLSGNKHYNVLSHSILGNVLWADIGRFMPPIIPEVAASNVVTMARAKKVRDIIRFPQATTAAAGVIAGDKRLSDVPINSVIRFMSAVYTGTNLTAFANNCATGINVRAFSSSFNTGGNVYILNSAAIPATMIETNTGYAICGFSYTNTLTGGLPFATVTNGATELTQGGISLQLQNLSGATLTNFSGIVTVEYDTAY
jgi:hypothetical protein